MFTLKYKNYIFNIYIIFIKGEIKVKNSPKKFLIKFMIFIFLINIFSITYAAYQFVKTYVIDNGYLYQNNDGITVKEFKEQKIFQIFKYTIKQESY